MKTIKQQLLLSLCSMVLLVLMLQLGAKAQILNCPSFRYPNDDCENNQSVFASYDAEQCTGFKVLDGTKAQEEYVREKLKITTGDDIHFEYAIVAMRSLIELIRMDEKFQQINGNSQDIQLNVTQLLLHKVAQDACLWLNEFEDINISNCTNINITELEALHARLVLYQTASSTYTILYDLLGDVQSDPVHYCAWVNDRIINNCNGTNPAHIDELNTHLCAIQSNTRPCQQFHLYSY